MSDRVDRIKRDILQQPYKPSESIVGPGGNFDRAVVEILRGFNDRLNNLVDRTRTVEANTDVIG